MSSETSRVRQQLLALERRCGQQLQLLLGEHGPLFRGTFGVRQRACGNPGCKCARGERHRGAYLSAAVDGQTRQIHVPARDELMVTEGVSRYRRFLQRRRVLAELAQRQLELIDALGRSLLAPYPPDNPLPPPKRRGRPPKSRTEP